MYGLNAVSLVFFGCINVLAYRLCKCDVRLRRRVICALCIRNRRQFGKFSALRAANMRA